MSATKGYDQEVAKRKADHESHCSRPRSLLPGRYHQPDEETLHQKVQTSKQTYAIKIQDNASSYGKIIQSIFQAVC